MEIHERIKKLRKCLKLSQTAFGERLGVSRSVINNIELNVLARPEQKLSLYKLICSEFNVSEDWLLNGVGDMYVSNKTEYGALIDRIMTGKNEFAKNIFKTFALFDENDWNALQRVMEKFDYAANVDADSIYNKIPDTPEELEKEYPPVTELNDNESNAG